MTLNKSVSVHISWYWYWKFSVGKKKFWSSLILLCISEAEPPSESHPESSVFFHWLKIEDCWLVVWYCIVLSSFYDYSPWLLLFILCRMFYFTSVYPLVQHIELPCVWNTRYEPSCLPLATRGIILSLVPRGTFIYHIHCVKLIVEQQQQQKNSDQKCRMIVTETIESSGEDAAWWIPFDSLQKSVNCLKWDCSDIFSSEPSVF